MRSMYDRSCPHLYRGVVESNIDPENLGRCKVRVPSIHGSLVPDLVEALPWARPLVLSPVHRGKGSVNIPDIGDIVWVIFEESHRDQPIYFGGTYGRDDLYIDNNVVDFYIEEDTQISYDRSSKTCSVRVGSNQIQVSPSGIYLSGDTRISGTLTVDDLIINNSCNRECDCT